MIEYDTALALFQQGIVDGINNKYATMMFVDFTSALDIEIYDRVQLKHRIINRNFNDDDIPLTLTSQYGQFIRRMNPSHIRMRHIIGERIRIPHKLLYITSEGDVLEKQGYDFIKISHKEISTQGLQVICSQPPRLLTVIDFLNDCYKDLVYTGMHHESCGNIVSSFHCTNNEVISLFESMMDEFTAYGSESINNITYNEIYSEGYMVADEFEFFPPIPTI